MKRIILFLLIAVPFLAYESFSQGCSDAGFCTMGAMRPNQGFSKKVNLRVRSVEFTQYYALTSFYLEILSYTADVNIGITNKLTAQIKLPYQFVFGDLAHTQGLGDVSISVTQNLINKEAYQLNLSVGTKIPTGNANQTTHVADRNGHFEDRPLPMYYQTTLGTYDAIAGISLATKNWLFATGIQIPLNKNGNQFLWGGPNGWNGTPDSASAQQYPKSRNLQRGTDIMLRIERNFRFSNWNAYIGLLSIYRVTKDKFLDAPFKNGVEREITTDNAFFTKYDIPTHNLAVTILAGGGYRFNTKSAIKLMFGYRLIDRNAIQILNGVDFEMWRNPDGLSRLMVTNIGYEYRF